MNLDFLSLINKPGRYINSEWNSIHKKHTKDIVKMCFCFPDLYEVGASNLGIEILYQIVNNRTDALAERCFCPDIDLENIMQKDNIALFSLESNTSIKDFDIVGFSLQYELSLTNVLNMLAMSKISLYRKDRKDIFPLVIAGGPVCSNPAPVNQFFDLFVLGEAEDVINEIINVVKNFKIDVIANNTSLRAPQFLLAQESMGDESISRRSLLEQLSRIDGIYVPGYSRDKVRSLIVDIENSSYPVKQIVPYVHTIHNRFNVEISRGCVYRCKFCSATALYKPWREKSVPRIMSIIKQGISNTGYEQLSLGSFSVSNYSRIDELLEETEKFCHQTNTFISVPSLRCNAKSARLLKYLIKPHRTNLTFAVEAGSERLRKFICKEITDSDIFETLIVAKKLGWKLIKLYFMIGLPTETMDDIVAIVDLIKKIQKFLQGVNLNITVSPFVPKPHTPFQWEKQENIDSLKEKYRILRENIKRINFKFHNLYMSELEGVFSRGDEKLNAVIYKAWSKGAKFDQWKEKFNFAIWEESFKECSIQPDEYLAERVHGISMPWSNIEYNE